MPKPAPRQQMAYHADEQNTTRQIDPRVVAAPPATREFTIFLWSTVAALVSAAVCLTWSPTTMPTWPPPTNTSPYQIVAVMVLMVGSASALSCLTPRIYTGAYAAAAGIYAGFAIPFIYLSTLR